MPKQKHVPNKFYTQRIERENLNLRNILKLLNRKTLGYSKSQKCMTKSSGHSLYVNALYIDKVLARYRPRLIATSSLIILKFSSNPQLRISK
ncbi:hypothetical protein J4727_02250 [Providencia rettgeri]|uniref:Transposase n=1 Tax=Providencia rettgeri TaxID=587 RepID=A0A939NFJ3_PRORE|nr:hypothetical protein [Providencia rettgeri]